METATVYLERKTRSKRVFFRGPVFVVAFVFVTNCNWPAGHWSGVTKLDHSTTFNW